MYIFEDQNMEKKYYETIQLFFSYKLFNPEENSKIALALMAQLKKLLNELLYLEKTVYKNNYIISLTTSA